MAGGTSVPWRSQRIVRYRYRQQYRQVTFFLKRAKAWRSLDPPTKQHRDILLPAACTQLSLGPSAHRVDVATLLLSRCNALLTRRPGGPDISRISPDAGRPESQFLTAIPCDGELRRANAAIHLFRPARELEHSAETSSTPSRQMPPSFMLAWKTTPSHATAGRDGPWGARVSGVRAINSMSSSTLGAWSTRHAKIASSSTVGHFALATRGLALAAQFFRGFAAFRQPARRPDHVIDRGPHALRHHHVPN